jgi:hypothetical protein
MPFMPVVRRASVVVLAMLTVSLTAMDARADWTPIKPASAPSSWNTGKALAATDGFVLSAWANDCPPPSGRCATNGQPKMGVFVQRARSNVRRLRWSTPRRMSPKGVHAERTTLAADGPRAIVGWVTQTRYRGFRPAAKRVFWIRRSGNEGKAWGARIRLSNPQGRVDYPRVALEGSRAYAVWTDADDGRIRFAMSTDAGRSWTRTTVGSTTAVGGRPSHGFAGLPDIGVSGSNVVITWYTDGGGRQVALTSSNAGGDLGPSSIPTELTASGPPNGVRYAAAQGATDGLSNRVAVAYTTATGLAVRVWVGGVLNLERTVATWPFTVDGQSYADGYGPAVLPSGTSSLTVAFAACRSRPIANDCDAFDPGARINVVVRDSGDAGFTWSSFDPITDATDPPYRTNDEPSLARTGSVLRVSFVRYQSDFSDFRVSARTRTP